jgi:hypothetical protein
LAGAPCLGMKPKEPIKKIENLQKVVRDEEVRELKQ